LTGASYRRGQPSSFGDTQQSTFMPGQQGAPANPGAGAGYTFICRPFAWMRLVAVSFDLVTSSQAANRYVQITYPDGTAIPIARDLTTFAQVASKTVHYSGTLDGLIGQDGASTVSASFRLSGLWLELGRSVVVSVVNIDSGDQLSNLRLTFDHNVPEDAGVAGNQLGNIAQAGVRGHDG
jgi:hypothetical protein